MEGQQKAFDTPFGSSVISDHPLVTPSILGAAPGPSMAEAAAQLVAKRPASSLPSSQGRRETLPGTQQLCGPCAGGGFCPIHSPNGHAAAGTWGVVAQGEPVPATETLGTIVGDFLEKLVGHVTKRVTDDVKREMREMEDRLAMAMVSLQDPAAEGLPTTYDEYMRTFSEQRLTELGDALDEAGVTNNYVVGDQGELSMLLVHDAHHRMWTICSSSPISPLFVLRQSEGVLDPMFAESVVSHFRAMKEEVEPPLPDTEV